jgi:hypothetical protein
MSDRNRATDGDDAAFIDRVAVPLRAAERADATFGERVMSAVRAEVQERASAGGSASPARSRSAFWRRSWSIRLTPVTALAAAAAVVALALLGSRTLTARRAAAPTMAAAPQDTVYLVRFVLLAPDARSVALVGDFNNWNRAATALAPAGGEGMWTASVALPPGRHEYAFIVNGERWMADPLATVTIHDDFGTASSILTVGARQS